MMNKHFKTKMAYLLVTGLLTSLSWAQNKPEAKTDRPTHARKDGTHDFGVQYMSANNDRCGSAPRSNTRNITRISKLKGHWLADDACGVINGNQVTVYYPEATEITPLDDWLAGANMETFYSLDADKK